MIHSDVGITTHPPPDQSQQIKQTARSVVVARPGVEPQRQTFTLSLQPCGEAARWPTTCCWTGQRHLSGPLRCRPKASGCSRVSVLWMAEWREGWRDERAAHPTGISRYSGRADPLPPQHRNAGHGKAGVSLQGQGKRAAPFDASARQGPNSVSWGPKAHVWHWSCLPYNHIIPFPLESLLGPLVRQAAHGLRSGCETWGSKMALVAAQWPAWPNRAECAFPTGIVHSHPYRSNYTIPSCLHCSSSIHYPCQLHLRGHNRSSAQNCLGSPAAFIPAPWLCHWPMPASAPMLSQGPHERWPVQSLPGRVPATAEECQVELQKATFPQHQCPQLPTTSTQRDKSACEGGYVSVQVWTHRLPARGFIGRRTLKHFSLPSPLLNKPYLSLGQHASKETPCLKHSQAPLHRVLYM